MGLKVTSIVNAGTFEVFPPWHWEGKSDIRVTVSRPQCVMRGGSQLRTRPRKSWNPSSWTGKYNSGTRRKRTLTA